ncbi:MAG: prepilin-type N-terminal cleavage/methylation domain-containing protein [Verrucomicrobiota bacterium]
MTLRATYFRMRCAAVRSPRSHGGTRRRAFTLLEVLLSLAIFAFAAVVLASSYLNILIGYDAVSRGALVGEDLAFARQLVLLQPDRKKLEEGGDFETVGGRRATWRVEIKSTNVGDLYDVDFTCEITEPGRALPDKVTQTFRLLRPTWVVDAGEQGKLKEEMKTRILEMQGKLKAGQMK